MSRLATVILLAGLLARGAIAAPLLPSTLNEQAEFLAGIPLPKGSILHPLQKSPEYRQHQKELQEQWGFCRRIRYEAMRQWAREHLSRQPSTRGVLRYLFGGPDFLNAYAFFPDTRVMVLGGLEPVGEVPPPEALDPNALGAALKCLDEALHTSLFCGYFITSEMKPQLVQGSLRGVLPVLYTELALTGNLIDSVQTVRPFGSPGVQIIYHRAGGPPQTLFYFQADLSNGKECRRFLSWLGDLGPGASYLKAASYLLPLDSFSETRNFLIRTSELILQDDSGLPFRSFLPGEWRIQLFGVYTAPLEIFKLKRDPLLEEAYRLEAKSGHLPFGAGYHVNPSDANLLLAVRNTPQGLLPAPMIEGENAPAAVPAFATPTPRPRPGPVRNALPVPNRKAIPVKTPRPIEAVAPIVPPPSVIPQQIPTTTPTPTAVLPEEEWMPSHSTDGTDQDPITSRAMDPVPVTAPPVTEEIPAPIPLTPEGKPID